MRRGLRLLVDPDPGPEERKRVYGFFGYECAFCGIKLENGAGDLDHLVSASRGGTNYISNRVLSCKRCNADEKRDADWVGFLAKKAPEGVTFNRRKERIEDWILAAGGIRTLNPEIVRLLEDEGSKATEAYDAACNKVRKAQHRLLNDARASFGEHQNEDRTAEKL